MSPVYRNAVTAFLGGLPERLGLPDAATAFLGGRRSLVASPYEPAEYPDARADVPRAAAGGRAADRVRGPAHSRHAQGAGGRGDLRAGLDHRLARWLPGPPAPADHVAGTDARPDRRQAAHVG